MLKLLVSKNKNQALRQHSSCLATHVSIYEHNSTSAVVPLLEHYRPRWPEPPAPPSPIPGQFEGEEIDNTTNTSRNR